MPPQEFHRETFWDRIDNACWRGELLHLGPELNTTDLAGDEALVLGMVFRAEAGNLDGSNPKYSQLVDRLGVDGPGAHSARVALAYARISFLVGQWQNCLDALQQAAVTSLRDRDADLPRLRRLRCETYLRLADFWAVMHQSGHVVAYLTLAYHAYPQGSLRVLIRARRLCANHGPASAALLDLASQGRWSTLFQLLTNRNFSELPEVSWPDPPSPEKVAEDHGWLTAFELCLAEALSTSGYSGRYWARTAVELAMKMQSPGCVAIADLTLAHHAIATDEYEPGVTHLSRALELIPECHFEGLLTYAMLINLPLEEQQGLSRANEQARQAVTQVVSQVQLFRDLVSRRTFISAHQNVFLKAFYYAQESGQLEAALKMLLEAQGLGLRTTQSKNGSLQTALEARTKELGPALIGEELFVPHSMRVGVCGPNTWKASSEVEGYLEVSDTIARREALQLVREELFGPATHIPVTLQEPPAETLEIYFFTDRDKTYRIDRWSNETKLTTIAIGSEAIRDSAEASGLSMTTSNRRGPVDYAPIDAVLESLLRDLPSEAIRISIWPHGPLHFLPFTHAIRSRCSTVRGVTSMLAIEQCPGPPSGHGVPVRLAPDYEYAKLAKSEAEVVETAEPGDVVKGGCSIKANEILELLFTSPSLFHFAGHAVNPNDHPELAGLYGSDLQLVSAADILNLGTGGPRATVLSACETGPGAIHSADGSYSLPRSFLQAGSEWVLASLWTVDDEETFRLMKRFFANLQQGLSPEASLPPTRHPFVVYRATAHAVHV